MRIVLGCALALTGVLGAVAWAQDRPTPPPPPNPPAQEEPLPKPGEAGPRPLEGMDDRDIRELVETVRMVRLSKELGLNQEETVLMIREFNGFRERFQEMNRQRQQLLRGMREKVRGGATDEEVQAALDALIAHDREAFEARQKALQDAGKNLDAKQRAKLYVFMSEFDQDIRQLIQKAREAGAGGGRLMRFREMRDGLQGQPGSGMSAGPPADGAQPGPPPQGPNADRPAMRRPMRRQADEPRPPAQEPPPAP